MTRINEFTVLGTFIYMMVQREDVLYEGGGRFLPGSFALPGVTVEEGLRVSFRRLGGAGVVGADGVFAGVSGIGGVAGMVGVEAPRREMVRGCIGGGVAGLDKVSGAIDGVDSSCVVVTLAEISLH